MPSILRSPSWGATLFVMLVCRSTKHRGNVVRRWDRICVLPRADRSGVDAL